MANRRLYDSRSFLVETVLEFGRVWHLVGTFTPGSIVSKYPDTKYRIRVKPNLRWRKIRKVSFRADRVYECESIGSVTRKHIYGSGQWFISPYRPPGESWVAVGGEFAFEDFDANPYPPDDKDASTPRQLQMKLP